MKYGYPSIQGGHTLFVSRTVNYDDIHTHATISAVKFNNIPMQRMRSSDRPVYTDN